MPAVNARKILHKATEGKYAVGAFNITSISQMEGVLETAEAMSAPVIIQTSVTPSKFLKPEVIAASFHAVAKEMKVPACLHLDHCADTGWCKRCSDAGYTSIMIDGSRYPFKQNISITAEIAAYCHSADQSVEGELGTVKGVEDEISVEEGKDELCRPELAAEFVRKTQIDIFAPAIGTAHGVYKTSAPRVDFERLKQIAARLDEEQISIPLVIHGGTGLPDDYILKLVASGGSKFNVSTALKHVLINSTDEYLKEYKNDYNPGALDKYVREKTGEEIIRWIKILGSEKQA